MSVPYHYWSLIDHKIHDLDDTDLEQLAIMVGAGEARLLTLAELTKEGYPLDHSAMISIALSRLKERIPLYDIRSDRIYLIHWENVYSRVVYEHYRLVDHTWYDIQKAKHSSKSAQNLAIMDAYHLPTLSITYAQIFWDSYQKANYVTNCVRRSYYPGSDHLEPYYRYNELVYLANDWNLTKQIAPSPEETDRLCALLVSKDIPSETLIQHQLHISKHNRIGLVKHYSLFGSYFINQYLRWTGCCLPKMLPKDQPIGETDHQLYRNRFLESQTQTMIRLIASAPAFTEEYTVYRFISRDDYIASLGVGDVYTDPSFTSTTRNPFHHQDNNAFGSIVLRIRLPKDIIGLALCIEAYSNFPGEQEILLMPTSQYRIDAITKDDPHIIDYHRAFGLKVYRKYDLTWIGHQYLDLASKQPIKLSTRSLPTPKIPTVDPVSIAKGNELGQIAIADRLAHFRGMLNENGQFLTIVDDQEYLMVVESYNSTTVYSPFFYWERPDGIMITHYHPVLGSVSLLLEISRTMHVNYYFKYSVSGIDQSGRKPGAPIESNSIHLDQESWVRWLASMCYLVGCDSMVIHSDYQLRPFRAKQTTRQKIEHTKYTYSADIYRYLKSKERRFDRFPEITCSFDYSQLDLLQYVEMDRVASKQDRSELYRIQQDSRITDLYQFYRFILEHHPMMRTVLEDRIDALGIYPANTVNPFQKCYYTLQPWAFLQNLGWISQVPLLEEFQKSCTKRKRLIGDHPGQIHQFHNRMRNLVQIQERFLGTEV